MPISSYFRGHGSRVMAEMKKLHGEEAGEREFYATSNKRGMKPEDEGAEAPKAKRRPGYKMGRKR